LPQSTASAFDTFNLDIMYALPGQTLGKRRQVYAWRFGAAAPHISIYHRSSPTPTSQSFRQRSPDDTAYAMLDQIADDGR
jgi:oxygen-independent coproporphyrinogen-3 oxidase